MSVQDQKRARSAQCREHPQVGKIAGGKSQRGLGSRQLAKRLFKVCVHGQRAAHHRRGARSCAVAPDRVDGRGGQTGTGGRGLHGGRIGATQTGEIHPGDSGVVRSGNRH